MSTRDKVLKLFDVCKVEDIIVNDRAREGVGDPEEYEKIKNSIKERGQMNPILVDRTDEGLILMGGYTRLTALKELGEKKVLVRYYDELDAVDRLIIELEENLHQALTWDEKAVLNDKIHKAHQEKYGKAKRGQEDSGWTMKDTANILGVSESSISQDVKLAKTLKGFPELKNLTSKKQALKSSSKLEEVAILSELARRDAEKSNGKSSTPYLLFHGYAEKVIKDKVEDETIDLVIFDPPWGIDVHKNASSRGPKGEKTSYKDDTYLTAFELIQKLQPELYRVMKEDAHMYMFCGIQDVPIWYNMLTGFENFNEFIETLQMMFPFHKEHLQPLISFFKDYYKSIKYRFYVERVPLIWVKEGGGYTDFEHKFMPRYETLLFCSKGVKKSLNEVVSNVLEYKRPATIKRIHTQEKPVDLIQRLIKISTLENEIVLDPCAGSFVTAEAATLSRRRSVCIDADEGCYAKGLDRISNLIINLDEEEEDESEV